MWAPPLGSPPPPQPEPTPRRGTIISKKGTEITFRSKNDLIHGFSMKRKQTFFGLSPVSLEVLGFRVRFFVSRRELGGFLRGAPQPDAVTRGCAGHQGGVGGAGEPGPQQLCDHFCLSLKARSWKVGTAGDRRPGVMGNVVTGRPGLLASQPRPRSAHREAAGSPTGWCQCSVLSTPHPAACFWLLEAIPRPVRKQDWEDL